MKIKYSLNKGRVRVIKVGSHTVSGDKVQLKQGPSESCKGWVSYSKWG